MSSPKHECISVADALVIKCAAVRWPDRNSLINLSSIEQIDVSFGLRLQPKYKCLQMVLDVYLNWRVCSGTEMERLNLQRPVCVCSYGRLCVTLMSISAYMCYMCVCVCRCLTYIWVCVWINDLQLNWWPVKDQMRSYRSGTGTVVR